MLQPDERGGQAAAGQFLDHGTGTRQVQAEAAGRGRHWRPVQARRGERVQVGGREDVKPVDPHRVTKQQVIGKLAGGREDVSRRRRHTAQAAASLSIVASRATSVTCRSWSARYHAAISLAPCSNGITARQPGTRLRSLALSNTIECALSPSRPAPHTGSAAAMASDGTCTRRAVTPSAAAKASAIWFQVSTSSEVMWMASPIVDRKSTLLNSSHPSISYAVFCL